MKRLLPVVLVLALVALGSLAGCSGSSTEPIEAPLFFSGEVAFQGNESHNFTVVSDGTLRFEMIRLQEKVAQGAEPRGLGLSIGLGVGRPTEDQCMTRYSVLVSEGDLVVLGLTGAEFCVLVFDGGTLFDGLVAEYTVSVSPG